MTGIINHPGAYAGLLRVPAGNVHPLPTEIRPDVAVLVEPLAAAIRTFELTPLKGGETVVILGCGRLGRMVALVASKAGARVIAVGRSLEHLDLISPFCRQRVRLLRPEDDPESSGDGYDVVRGNEQLQTLIRDLTAGLGADIVVEATARNENLKLAQDLVRPLGTIAMKSTSGVPVNGFDTTRATVDEIRLQGSRCGPFDKAIEFMVEHGLPDASWITARYPLEQAAEAVDAATREAKVVIEVDDLFMEV